MTEYVESTGLEPERASWADVPDARYNLGILPGLYRRLARWNFGDPIVKRTVTSTGPTDVQRLPDAPGAVAAVAFLSGSDIIYTVDGSVPDAAGTDVISLGSRITITGMPSIKGFQFASRFAATTTLSVTYYT